MMKNLFIERLKQIRNSRGNVYFTSKKGEIEHPCNQYTKIRYWYKFLYQRVRYKIKKSLYNIFKS